MKSVSYDVAAIALAERMALWCCQDPAATGTFTSPSDLWSRASSDTISQASRSLCSCMRSSTLHKHGPRVSHRPLALGSSSRLIPKSQLAAPRTTRHSGEIYLGRFAFTLVPFEAQWVKHGTQRRQPRRVDHEYLPAAVRSVISFQPPAC